MKCFMLITEFSLELYISITVRGLPSTTISVAKVHDMLEIGARAEFSLSRLLGATAARSFYESSPI